MHKEIKHKGKQKSNALKNDLHRGLGDEQEQFSSFIFRC